MLRTRRLRPEVPGPEQWERLLFYRGVGEFALPVQLREVDASLQVRFGGQRTIPAAWLIRVEGEQAGFRALGALAPDELRSVAGLQADRPAAAVVHEAATALVRGLQESGLYEDEARAMVDTWRRAWLRSPGTRLLYVLPRPWTDALLPLRVRPRPQQIERVLVGRVELLTQAMIERDRATLDEAVALAALRGTGDAAWARFGKLQPFAEPRLRWLCAQPGDEGHAAVSRGALRWSHRR